METTTTQTIRTESGDKLRERAAQREREAQESFDRCDTDGFLSQWASGLNAQRDRLAAEIADNGGFFPFPALFRGETLVAAKLMQTRFGTKWAVLESDDPRSRVTAWMGLTDKAVARHGYTVGTVMARGEAFIDSIGYGFSGRSWASVRRMDGGFSRDVRVVCTDRRRAE